MQPAYITNSWMTCTDGLSLRTQPPDHLRDERFLRSENLWERLVCVFLRAREGDLQHARTLLEIANSSGDSTLRGQALHLFALSSPTRQLLELTSFFKHPDYDTRLDAYSAARLSCSLDVAEKLVEHHAGASRDERESIQDKVSDLLESTDEDMELYDVSSHEVFQSKALAKIHVLRTNYPNGSAILGGVLLDSAALVKKIIELCQEEDVHENGGPIDTAFSLLEGLAGFPYAGSLDEACRPVFPKIASVINHIQQSGKLGQLKPGVHYFFGHPRDGV